MNEDRLKISIDIDFDNYDANIQNLNKALERLSKMTNLKLDFNVDSTTTEKLNQINEVLNKVNQTTRSMNNAKIGFNMDNFNSQIKDLKNYSGGLDEIKQKLTSLGEVKIKSDLIDEKGINQFTASINDATGKVINLRYTMDSFKDGQINYKFDGVKSLTDSTDKAINKLNEFKEKWQQTINSIGNQELLPNDSITNLQRGLDSLTVDSKKLDFDNIKKQINSVAQESDKLFRDQQNNIQKVISFIDRYNTKINNLYRNNNGGINNNDILNLENRINSLSGGSDTSQFKDIENQYSKLLEQQDDYKKQIQDENKQLREQESLIKYISSQQERLKNIQSNYSTKIDTNSNEFKSLQVQYDNIIQKLNQYKNASKELTLEQSTDVKERINDLNREKTKIIDLYNYIKAQSSNLDNIQLKFKDIIKPEDINNIKQELRQLMSSTNVAGDKNNIENSINKLAQRNKETIQSYKEQGNLIKYISTQQERLKNIQSNYSTKIDTNSGLYGNLQNQYRNIFNLLDEYREKKEKLTTEDKINITEQINNLRRLSSEYLNINTFIRSQENELNNLGKKYKNVLGENELNTYTNSLKGFDPDTDNLVGDMDKIIKKHQQLKTELDSRIKIQGLDKNLGENIGSLSSSGLGIDSGLRDIEKYLQQTVNAKASVSSIVDSLDGLGNKIRTVNYSVNEGHNVVSKYKATLDESTGSIYNMSKGVQDLSSKHGSLAESVQNAAMGFLKFQLIAGGFMGAINSLKEGISTINDLNKSITNISMVTGESINTVNQYMNQYTELSKQLHTTTTDVANAAEEFLRAGDTQKESMQMVKASTILSKEAGMSQEETAQGLIAIANSYDIVPDKIMSVVDKMTQLDNVSSTSVSELNAAMMKTASSAKEAGVPLDNLLSYIAQISSTTRISASSIGSGLNSIFSRFQSIKMGKDYDPDNNPINNVEKSLNSVGITIRKNKDEFKSFSTVLDEVGKNWSKYTGVQKNLISTQLAG